MVEDTWVQELKREKSYYNLITAGKILAHLQATCMGLHALDFIALQNKMQRYHINFKGIPEYINDPGDAQDKAEWANNPITDATLIIVAMKAMLITEKLSHSNEDWEELDVSKRIWGRLKTTYRSAANKAEIKKKYDGVKD